MTDPLTPERIAVLRAKYDAAIALQDETTGEAARALEGFPQNAWSAAVFAILDDAQALLDAAEALAKAQARITELEAELRRADWYCDVIISNRPNEPIADNGMTVWDGLVTDAIEFRRRAARLLNQE